MGCRGERQGAGGWRVGWGGVVALALTVCGALGGNRAFENGVSVRSLFPICLAFRQRFFLPNSAAPLLSLGHGAGCCRAVLGERVVAVGATKRRAG